MAKEWRKHSNVRDNGAFQNSGYPRCLQGRILSDFEFCFEYEVNIVSTFGNAFVVHIEMCFRELTSCVASLEMCCGY